MVAWDLPVHSQNPNWFPTRLVMFGRTVLIGTPVGAVCVGQHGIQHRAIHAFSCFVMLPMQNDTGADENYLWPCLFGSEHRRGE